MLVRGILGSTEVGAMLAVEGFLKGSGDLVSGVISTYIRRLEVGIGTDTCTSFKARLTKYPEPLVRKALGFGIRKDDALRPQL